jgi:hypothetical protein
MSTKADEDGNPKAEATSEEKEGSLFPAILAGAGILAVVAVLALWPSGDDAKDRASDAAGANGGAAGAAGAVGGVAGKGGVQARAADKASDNRSPEPKVNPAIKLPAVGMAPGVPPPEKPPEFNDRAEEIAWYERKLEAAKQMRDSRKKFAERLPQVRERIEQSDNPDAQLAAFESRKKIVEENYAKAQKRVEELEQKLADLQ